VEDYLLKFRNPIILVVVILLTNLTGCTNLIVPATNPTKSPVPTSVPASCLQGIWEIKNPEIFLLASLPVGAFDLDTLKFIGSEGSVAYRFDNQEILTVEASNFNGKFDVRDGNDLNQLVINMSGFASGEYQQEGDAISLTQMRSSDMNYSAIYLQEEMMSDVKADAFLPLFIHPYTSARYKCTDDTLSLEFLNFPNIPAALEFKRLR
jgi:hypothetical protein